MPDPTPKPDASTKLAQIVLTLDLSTLHVTVSGNVPTHEIALFMCEQGASAARDMLKAAQQKRVLSVADLGRMARG